MTDTFVAVLGLLVLMIAGMIGVARPAALTRFDSKIFGVKRSIEFPPGDEQ